MMTTKFHLMMPKRTDAEPDRKEFGLPRFITLERRAEDRHSAKGPFRRNPILRAASVVWRSHSMTQPKLQACRCRLLSMPFRASVPACESEGRVYNGRSFAAFGDHDCQRLRDC